MTTEALGSRVRELRTRRGMTQQTLAYEMVSAGCIHWRQTTVWKVEEDGRRLRLDEAAALADLFGLSLDELTGRVQPTTDERIEDIRDRALVDAIRAIGGLR